MNRKRKKRRFLVRSDDGAILELRSLAQLATLIRDGYVNDHTQLAAGGDAFRPLGEVVDAQSLKQTLEALGHMAPQP